MEGNGPSLDRLLNCDPESREFVACLRSIFSSKEDKERLFHHLRGSDAIRFMDLVDQAVDHSLHMDDRLRMKCLRALRKVSGSCGELPSSHIITEQLEQNDEGPQAGGGFADVYKGMYRNAHVAIKMFRIYGTDDMSKVKKKFCKEAVLWKWLRHPNILPFLGVFYDSGNKLAIVSEWMSHGSIVQYLKSYPGANRPQLLLEVAKGLEFLHSHEVIHGDLKGENILINNTLNACLADFGLASFWANAYSITVSLSEITTGTPRWMAPELIDADLSDLRVIKGWGPSSDIYSLAMVAVEVFTGNVPFHKFRSDAVVFKVKSGVRPDRPANAAPLGLTDDVWAMIELCWRQSREDRPTIESVVACFEVAVRNFVPEAHVHLLSVSVAEDDDTQSDISSLHDETSDTITDAHDASPILARSSIHIPSPLAENLNSSRIALDTHESKVQALPEGVSLAVLPDHVPDNIDLAGNTRKPSDQPVLLHEDLHQVVANFSLSHIAMTLRDKIHRVTRTKGGILYFRAFTGKDIISTIQSQIQHELLINYGILTIERHVALELARILHKKLLFTDLKREEGGLADGTDGVYAFLDEDPGRSNTPLERVELPTGVVRFPVKCYMPSRKGMLPSYASLDHYKTLGAQLRSADAKSQQLHNQDLIGSNRPSVTHTDGGDIIIVVSLYHVAVTLRDKTRRETHVKHNIPYYKAFTGKEVVSTIQSQIQNELLINYGIETNDRRAALALARILENRGVFCEVHRRESSLLSDGTEALYQFPEDQARGSKMILHREQFPTEVFTFSIKPYNPSRKADDRAPSYTFLWTRQKDVIVLKSF